MKNQQESTPEIKITEDKYENYSNLYFINRWVVTCKVVINKVYHKMYTNPTTKKSQMLSSSVVSDPASPEPNQ
jgi:hypothetical protein